MRRIWTRAGSAGSPISSCSSRRPGRRSASSIASSRFVVPATKMLLSGESPSNLESSCESTSEPVTLAPDPVSVSCRRAERVSISSKMIMCRCGGFTKARLPSPPPAEPPLNPACSAWSSWYSFCSRSASAKSSRMFDSERPTYWLKSSGPATRRTRESEMPSSRPSVRAASVLPVPGGPCSKSPRVCRSPSLSTRAGLSVRVASTRRAIVCSASSRPPIPNASPETRARSPCCAAAATVAASLTASAAAASECPSAAPSPPPAEASSAMPASPPLAGPRSISAQTRAHCEHWPLSAASTSRSRSNPSASSTSANVEPTSTGTPAAASLALWEMAVVGTDQRTPAKTLGGAPAGTPSSVYPPSSAGHRCARPSTPDATAARTASTPTVGASAPIKTTVLTGAKRARTRPSASARIAERLDERRSDEDMGISVHAPSAPASASSSLNSSRCALSGGAKRSTRCTCTVERECRASRSTSIARATSAA
mmetsp:Transcript_10762/g.25066  ORF Transcript_10762/g.25066 Transcript_10762/m.25066 type:complete len:485 (+) Transcript_10762:141-1595(+)